MAIALVAGFILSACQTSVPPPSPTTTAPASSPPIVVVAPATPTPTPVPTPAPTPESEAAMWKELPVTAGEPVALAAQLATAERAIRDPGITGSKLSFMAHLQQLVYRRLVDRPEWRTPLLAAMPEELRVIATANLAAGVDLRALTAPRTTLPAWRIVEPAPVEELLGYYKAAEAELGVPWPYLAAIHLTETRMGRIRGTSTAGAQGPMQFLPSTWAAYGRGDINDSRDAIRGAANYLKTNGAPANMANALFRYNNSDLYVRAVTAQARLMIADANAYRGYHGWQVYYLTVNGDVLLPVGYVR